MKIELKGLGEIIPVAIAAVTILVFPILLIIINVFQYGWVAHWDDLIVFIIYYGFVLFISYFILYWPLKRWRRKRKEEYENEYIQTMPKE